MINLLAAATAVGLQGQHIQTGIANSDLHAQRKTSRDGAERCVKRMDENMLRITDASTRHCEKVVCKAPGTIREENMRSIPRAYQYEMMVSSHEKSAA